MREAGKVFDGGHGLCRFPVHMKLSRLLLLFAVGLGMFASVSLRAAEAPEVENGYLRLGFDRLANYSFSAPAFDAAADPNTKPPTGEEQIPEEVKSWSGKKAIVTGFMLPTKMEKGLVTEFLLVKDAAMCCYGAVPNMNEWVVVRMPKGVRPLMDVPVSFYGELKVGAMFENGYMTGIYALEGEKMGEAKS